MSLNFGAGMTTFAMPSALFKHDIRSTFNGIACAMGKSGAILGAYSFYDIALASSYSTVLYICSIVAVCALVLTHFGIDQNEINHNTSEGEQCVIDVANKHTYNDTFNTITYIRSIHNTHSNTNNSTNTINNTNNNTERESEIELRDSKVSENPLQQNNTANLDNKQHQDAAENA
jgi:hypothetical protein